MFRLPHMPLGSRIRHYRLKAGWTLEQLSDRCGVDVGTINALENRNSRRSQYAVQIASGFGLTLNQLEDDAADYKVPANPDPIEVNQKSATYNSKLSDDEALLLQGFRAASEETRAAMLAFAKSVLPDRTDFDRRTGSD